LAWDDTCKVHHAVKLLCAALIIRKPGRNQRGFFLDNEILPLDTESVRRLAEVLSKLDEGVRKQLIA